MASFIPFGNPGLFDEFVQTLDVATFETPLMCVGRLVRWEVFDPFIQGVVTREANGPGGRPRFHPMLMFKVLVLQRHHGLADDAAAFKSLITTAFAPFSGSRLVTQCPMVRRSVTFANCSSRRRPSRACSTPSSRICKGNTGRPWRRKA